MKEHEAHNRTTLKAWEEKANKLNSKVYLMFVMNEKGEVQMINCCPKEIDLPEHLRTIANRVALIKG